MNLLKLRKEKKISQQELAKTLNVTQTTYGRYELELTEPTIETLIKLANFYNVSVDYLIGRNYTNDIGFLNDTQKAAVELIKSLNDLNLAKAIAYMSGLVVNQ